MYRPFNLYLFRLKASKFCRVSIFESINGSNINMHYIHALFFSFILAACSSQVAKKSEVAPTETKPINPQMLTDTPDLSRYRTLEITLNSTSTREAGQTQFFSDGSYLEVRFANPDAVQRLFVQVEECRNSIDQDCKRHFFISGDLMAFSSRLRCYIQIRNDLSSGYYGQAIQGFCQDTNKQSYSIVLVGYPANYGNAVRQG